MSRTSLTQGDRRIGSWPMRGYHPWSIALFKTFHQLVRFYSIKHTKDESLRELLPQKALSFMSSEEWKGICWGQVFLHCTKWEYLCQGHIWPSRLPWRFPLKPRLKRSHKYYTQTQEQMWVCGVCHGFFIGWTQGGPPFYHVLWASWTWHGILSRKQYYVVLQVICITMPVGVQGNFLIAQSAKKWF